MVLPTLQTAFSRGCFDFFSCHPVADCSTWPTFKLKQYNLTNHASAHVMAIKANIRACSVL